MDKENNIVYILTYLFALLSGIIIYLISDENERLKFHSKQAITLGVIIIILGLIPIISVLNILLWLYGIYLGIQAYHGRDVSIPLMPSYEKQAGKAQNKPKKLQKRTVQSDDEALKALKLRYAKGKITKKQFTDMKKELE